MKAKINQDRQPREGPQFRSVEHDFQGSKVRFAQELDQAVKPPHSRLPDVFNTRNMKKFIPDQAWQQSKKQKDLKAILDAKEYEDAKRQLQPIKQQAKYRHSSNPIEPVRKHFQNINKMSQNFQINSPGNFNPFQISKPTLLSSNFHVHQFITLSIVKTHRSSALVKKMLHVPTCKIYCVKQQPYTSKENRNNLRQWLSFWQSKLNEIPESIVKVYETFWNSPEGCVSIVQQYCPYGSLENLLTVMIELPQSVIKSIAQEILLILADFHKFSQQAHQGIKPSQILLSKTGEVKLSMGLGSKVGIQSNLFNLSQTKFSDKRINLYQSFYVNRQNLWVRGIINQSGKSQDTFSLGMVLLHSALGGFDLIESFNQIYESAKTIDLQNKGEGYCCVLHLTNRSGQTPLWSFLQQKRFSADFKDFLCKCLRLSSKKRPSIQQLLAHQFFKNDSCRIIKAAYAGPKELPKQVMFVNSQKLQAFYQRIGICLQECSVIRESVLQNLNSNQLQLLSNELGENVQNVVQKLTKVYSL